MTGEILHNLESDKSATEIVDRLTEIWQRVLQRPDICPDDEFRSLGGHEALADEMFAEIAQVFGRQLPAATIWQASTIATLAAVIQQPTLPRLVPFVKLKTGTLKTPILIAHGLDGRARFLKLAQHIRTENSIYGIQAKGIDGLEHPLDRIEDMAAFYLEALNDLQPIGPYILIGYSFGGLVALEMAQRIVADGKEIALLVLIDAYPHPRFLSLRQQLLLSAKRTRRHISEMTQRSVGNAFSYFVEGLKHRMQVAGVRRRDTLPAETFRLSFARTTVRVQEQSYVAYRSYRPRFYPGKIKFVKAGVNSYFPDDPAAVWSKLAEGFEVSTVPGGHLDIVTSEFESLAHVLTGYLQGVPCQE
jgi:acetoacetyl-CoA synthetase